MKIKIVNIGNAFNCKTQDGREILLQWFGDESDKHYNGNNDELTFDEINAIICRLWRLPIDYSRSATINVKNELKKSDRDLCFKCKGVGRYSTTENKRWYNTDCDVCDTLGYIIRKKENK